MFGYPLCGLRHMRPSLRPMRANAIRDCTPTGPRHVRLRTERAAPFSATACPGYDIRG